jgi:hypothetical protein
MPGRISRAEAIREATEFPDLRSSPPAIEEDKISGSVIQMF